MRASSNDPISSLAAQTVPVTPVPLPRVRLGQWLLWGGSALAVVIAFGLRRDWSNALAFWPVWGHTVLLAAVAGWGAWAALRLAVPGEAEPRAVVWPLFLAAAWVVWMGMDLGSAGGSSTAWAIGAGWRCIVRAVVGSAIAGASLLLFVRRAMPLATRPVAIAVAASTAATGELAAEWMCPNMQAMHVVAWHAVPFVAVVAVAAVGAGALIGHESLNRIRSRYT